MCVCQDQCECVRAWNISIWFVARVLVVCYAHRYADRKADVNCTAGESLRQSCERCQDESGDRRPVTMLWSLQLTHKEKHRYVRICMLHQPFQIGTYSSLDTLIALMQLRLTLQLATEKLLNIHPSITLTGRITGWYKLRNISDSAEHNARFIVLPSVYRTELIIVPWTW